MAGSFEDLAHHATDHSLVLVQRAGSDPLHHRLGDLLVGGGPDVHHLVVALAVGDQTRRVLSLDFLYLRLRAFQDRALLLRHLHVVDADRDSGPGRIAEPGVHELVREHDSLFQTHLAVAGVDERRQGALVDDPVDEVEGQSFGHQLREQGAAHRGLHQGPLPQLLRCAVVLLLHPHPDPRVQIDRRGLESPVDFRYVAEHHAGALCIGALPGHVVEPEHHVLGRHDDRLAVGRRQDVVGGHHQRARFELRLDGERHVNRHLIAVEVGVERGAHEGMKLYRLALDEDRLEGLDPQAMQSGRPVEHDRVLPDHLSSRMSHTSGPSRSTASLPP